MITASGIKTEQNILKAFQAESRAKWIYQAFAEEAEKEGNHQVAKLFRAAAESETIHANSLLKALQEMSRATSELWMAGMYDPKMIRDSIAENLKEAITGWLYEFSKQYPQMIRDATKDGWDLARDCFNYANAVEKIHIRLFKEALHSLGKKGDVDYYVCESCGNTMENKPVGSCKVCGSSESAFKAVE